jgi:hypothetical protein
VFKRVKAHRNRDIDFWTDVDERAVKKFGTVEWSQLVDNGLQQKDVRNSLELKMMLVIVLGGALIGLWFGGLGGALVGLFVGMWVAPGVDRNAVPPKLENVGGSVPMPGRWGSRADTPREQQLDQEPIVEEHECKACILQSGDDLNFSVLWRNAKTKRITKDVMIPWAGFSPFSLESAAALYGDRLQRQRYAPAIAIMLRLKSSTAPIEIAHDMGSDANLQHVFGRLSENFGAERQAAYYRSKKSEPLQPGREGPISDPLNPTAPRPRPRL